MDRDERVVDLAVERFLVLANLLAAADPDAVRRVVKTAGSTFAYRPGVDDVARWAVHGRTMTDHGSDDLASRRTNHVAGRIGSLPAILSAPSWEDLRVDVADLAQRLGAYAEAGVPVVDTDLLLALLRLEPGSATAEAKARLAALDVPVIAFNGPPRPGAEAGSVVLGYLEHPLAEPVITPAPGFAGWARSTVEIPGALRFTPVRPSPNAWASETFSTFPAWGDAIGKALGGDGYEPAEATPVEAWTQLARRAAPLTPGLAVNLLAGLRRKGTVARAAQFDAARLAWERGLLRPGVADLASIDWDGTPTQLAALAEAWLEAAEDGLLPAVWPLLDGLCAWSAPQRRMPTGASEVSAAMARLAPSVLAAVGRGDAPAEALRVPGLRALAARGGASQAVVNARAALVGLPEADAPEAPAASAAPARLTDAEFEAAWRLPKKGLPDPAVIPDGATLVARALPRPASWAGLVFDLGVPGEPATLRGDKWTWTHDLSSGRTCHAVRLGADGELPPGVRPGSSDCWLAWEPGEGLTVHRFPDRRYAPVLSSTLGAIAVGILAQNGDGGHAGRDCLETLLQGGFLGPSRVADAARTLLPFADAVSPARLAGAVRKLPRWLPALWPLLTEAVAHAATLGTPPRWLAQVLDVALEFAPVLREAGARGIIPREWEGLADLAARPGKAAARDKARLLVETLA